MTTTTLVIGGLERQVLEQAKEVRFCSRCVMSNQRPRIKFEPDTGVCSACEFYDHQQEVDWVERERELRELLGMYRTKGSGYDVIVPTSGGKDSVYVACSLRDLGMSPLCVCWAPFERTAIGQRNYKSFINAGFTVLEGHPDGEIHRALTRLSFEELGDPWSPFAWGQMSFAFRVAEMTKIPLVFFGENGEAMYSGDPRVWDLNGMPLSMWEEQYWKGTNPREMLEFGVANKPYMAAFSKNANLDFYTPPCGDFKVDMKWMNYYRQWTPQENFYFATQHTGFEANPQRSTGTHTKYASLDDRLDPFHYWLGLLKFGIGRCTSDCSHEIREGHITREEGVALVHRYDQEFPDGEATAFALDYMGISYAQFWEIANAWRPAHIWHMDQKTENWSLKHMVQ